MTIVTVKCTSDTCSEERDVEPGEVPHFKLPKCPECGSGMIPENLMDLKERILAMFELEE